MQTPPPGFTSGPDERLVPDPTLETSDAEKLRLVGEVLDLLPDFFYVADRDLRIRYANRSVAQHYGLTKEQIVGRLLADIDPEKEQAAFFLDYCRDVMDKGEPRQVERIPIRRRDGSAGYVRQFDIPFRHEPTGEMMLIGLSRDVTDEVELQSQRIKTAEFERELQIARRIQESLRPAEGVTIAGLDVAAFSQPAAYAGGDFHDWGLTGRGQFAMCIGDVTGHGVGAALLAATSRAYARALIGLCPLEEAMARIATQLTADTSDGRFVTFAAVTIDPSNFTLRMASAGHGPSVIVRADGAIEHLPTHTAPMGIPGTAEEASALRAHETFLAPGDRLVLVSDGVFESRNDAGEFFGTERMIDMLRRERSDDARRDVEACVARLGAFARGRAFDDDVTIVIARRKDR
jgi:PAS domain S-box-containing protein